MSRNRTVNGAKKSTRRAVQARARNTVEAIIEAAARILANDGWAAFNTNAVARLAGVSIGSVYEYFENKEAILEIIIDRHLSSGEAQLTGRATLASPGSSLDDIVRLLVEGFISVHCENPRLHKVLSGEVPITDRQRDRIDQIRSRAISLVAILLRGRVERPEIKATMMIDAADALTHRWFIDEQGVPASRDEVTQELKQMLRSYLDK